MASAEDHARSIRSLAPFIGASLIAWGTGPLEGQVNWRLYTISVGFAVLAGFICLQPMRSFFDRVRETIASLIYLLAVLLLRDSSGGIMSGVAVVAILPVFYTALNAGDRRQLAVVTSAVAVAFLLPILVIGGPRYPQSQLRLVVLFLAVSAIVGLATQRLVLRARFQARAAERREQMLERVAEVVRALYTSTGEQARREVCQAAMTISDAIFAILYEPSATPGGLRSTAMAGIAVEPIEIGPQERASAIDAFRSSRPVLVHESDGDETIHAAIRERTGPSTSILYEPLLGGSETAGVLVVGWPREIHVDSSRATVVALLAHEVSAVIERADLLSKVTDLASTDPLTGLPNRRAWDARLAEAMLEEQQLVVAMLDVDHFKEFNDGHGHPGGDRLLKEAAAAWREQLRAGDLLARIGGDEFALLLMSCNQAHALTVINRLRRRMPNEQKCSVGLAERRDGESPEQLLARADAALYEAKSAGRDRALVHS